LKSYLFLKTGCRALGLAGPVAALAWCLGKAVPVVGTPSSGMLLGICSPLETARRFRRGVRYTSKKLLQGPSCWAST
jgi:uncharacterized membrane protein YadS